MGAFKSRTVAIVGGLAITGLLGGCGLQPSPSSGGGGSQASSAKKSNIVVALSNGYDGNAWRHQMVTDFISAAKQAKHQGLISSYIVDNSTNGLQQQIQQMDSLILQHVSAICIDSASASGLNGVIAKAHQAGIPVISLDTGVTSPYTYNINTSFKQSAQTLMSQLAQLMHGQGNLVILRTQAGTKSDQELWAGYQAALAKYPKIKVVGSIYGNADTATVESGLGSLIPSLPKVKAVLSLAGSMGAVAAFKSAHQPMPIITNGLTSASIHWWIQQHQKNGYTTVGMDSRPSEGAAALWMASDILHGQKVPKNVTMGFAEVTQQTLYKYKNLPPNTFADPQVTHAWVQHYLLK